MTEFGPPERHEQGELGEVYIWEGLGGEGLVLVRSEDDWASCAAQAKKLLNDGCTPWAIITSSCPGSAPWEQRLDLALALEAISERNLEWLAAAGLDQLTRDKSNGPRLLAELASRGASLILPPSLSGPGVMLVL